MSKRRPVPGDPSLEYREESFGGVVSCQDPPMLAFVDREYLRGLGAPESELWAGEEAVGRLSAPTEVHFAVTNRCSNQCPHCYMDAGAPESGELGTDDIKRGLEALAELGVFHVAMGGGEALERPDLFELAAHARSLGIVPNLTVSGVGVSEEIAERMRVFGQVNVSMDGVGEAAAVFRGRDLFAAADAALERLLAAGVPAGINCVVGRRNFDGLSELFAYAAAKGANEIEFLRYKPSGRGALAYDREATTREDNEKLASLLAEQSGEYELTAKIDCSFVPMLCWSEPPLELMRAMATFGCEAGNVLLGARANGAVSGCSFLASQGASLFDLSGLLANAGVDPASGHRRLPDMAAWSASAPEPCCSCAYLDVCKGGCRAVALAVTGDFHAPDPDCPRVVAWRGEKAGR